MIGHQVQFLKMFHLGDNIKEAGPLVGVGRLTAALTVS